MNEAKPGHYRKVKLGTPFVRDEFVFFWVYGHEIEATVSQAYTRVSPTDDGVDYILSLRVKEALTFVTCNAVRVPDIYEVGQPTQIEIVRMYEPHREKIFDYIKETYPEDFGPEPSLLHGILAYVKLWFKQKFGGNK